MLTCAEATRLASEAQDHPLTWRQRVQFRMHLLLCGACRRFASQLNWLQVAGSRLTGHAELEAANESLSTVARERIRAALRGDSERH